MMSEIMNDSGCNLPEEDTTIFKFLSPQSIATLSASMKINSVYKTLGEQLHINEVEIRQRKVLLGFDFDDEKLLEKSLIWIVDDIATIIERFYDKQIEIDEVALIIGDADTLGRLKNTMQGYVRELFSGSYELEYTNSRLRIGLIHKRIGVSPKYYLSALLSLKQNIFAILEQNVADAAQCEKIKASLDKLLMLDSQLVFDAYFRSMLLEVEVARDRAEKNEAQLETIVADRTQKLEELARKDALTGLWNRRHFIEELFCEIVRSKRQSLHLSVLYIDLDGFKQLNDSQGHLVGDDALCNFGQELTGLCRNYDTVARMGGDEFVILLPGLDSQQATEVAKRILVWDKKQHYDISMSIGIATTGLEYWVETPEELLALADAAMYLAKHNGGSRYIVANTVQPEVNEKEQV
ncbi:protoglobin domain-containing protein [Acinetobacter puyangensis]